MSHYFLVLPRFIKLVLSFLAGTWHRNVTSLICVPAQEVSSAAGGEGKNPECVRQEEDPGGGSERSYWSQLQSLCQTSPAQDYQEETEEVDIKNAPYREVGKEM